MDYPPTEINHTVKIESSNDFIYIKRDDLILEVTYLIIDYLQYGPNPIYLHEYVEQWASTLDTPKKM